VYKDMRGLFWENTLIWENEKIHAVPMRLWFTGRTRSEPALYDNERDGQTGRDRA
jgi:hypothetical protein